MIQERRRYLRIDSHNLVFLSLREKEEVIQQGMGRTLNVSESGIRLETRFLIKPAQKIWLTIGFNDETVDIQGELVYYISGTSDQHYGVKFHEMDPDVREVLKKYIINFNKIENQIN
ncbi:MAG: PilZ domain-containing protein [Proteobacteria bacterium]|nr:PilZ domain-containing protein [Pseudomonadota bacterium]MBU4053509.1 PilZ domain-containing protein [Pseudomonadota bacterium]MBU4317711.1 PilZ domain-containing protein [Pseudomonadota bacterium]MBU4470343.1 PilZ domain-containing protein [Pseudomonadota bacterium]MCG2752754.1 PilZ domain-containing protein [Desulfobacteraceae bacterium]